jgi:protein TonB
MRAAIASAAENGEALDAALAALREAPEGAALATQLAADIEARLQQRYLAEPAPASELRLVNAPPARYPEEAREAGVEGWVDIEFIVDRAGQTREARVLDARPTGLFDSAALATVAAYRYAPFERDGRVYERRLRLRIRFVLQ